MEESYVVCDFVQVTCDMRSDQDSVIFLLTEFPQKLQNLVPEDGVQSVCSLIHDEKFRIVTECDGKFKLGSHPAGKGLEALFCRKSKPVQIGTKHVHIPVRIHIRQETSDLKWSKILIISGIVENDSQIRFDLVWLRFQIPSQNIQPTVVRGNDSQHRVNQS